MKKKVTAWASWNHKEEKWGHSHIEDGWAKDESPTQKKVYKGQEWMKVLGWLVDDGKSNQFFGHTNWPYFKPLVGKN